MHANSGAHAAEGIIMLAFILSLFAGRSYQWRPAIDVNDSFVVSTLFGDGGH